MEGMPLRAVQMFAPEIKPEMLNQLIDMLNNQEGLK